MAKKKKTDSVDDSINAGLAQHDLNESLMGAISESNDPNARLKKLRNPINVLSCLLNIVLMLAGTIGIGLFICSRFIDDFTLSVVVQDVLDKFGISAIFNSIRDWFANVFGGSA